MEGAMRLRLQSLCTGLILLSTLQQLRAAESTSEMIVHFKDESVDFAHFIANQNIDVKNVETIEVIDPERVCI
jgi:folate-dependent phosphoribosylglycinamide formyltransferase PurN